MGDRLMKFVPSLLTLVALLQGFVATLCVWANDVPGATRYFASGAFFFAWAINVRVAVREDRSNG